MIVLAVGTVAIAPLTLLGVWCAVGRITERRRIKRCRADDLAAMAARGKVRRL